MINKQIISELKNSVDVSQYLIFANSIDNMLKYHKNKASIFDIFIGKLVAKTDYFLVVESLIVPGIKECFTYVDILRNNGIVMETCSKKEAMNGVYMLRQSVLSKAA